MKLLKNIGIGFLVSFIGSIPLGYLNVVGFEMYQKLGIDFVYSYLLGICAVEFVVVYLTLIFAERLAAQKKLLKFIEFFSIFFMLALAFAFWFHSKGAVSNHDYLSKYDGRSAFMIGVILNSLNFVQLPFWIGWNLYLVNGGYIASQKSLRFFYIASTLVGTFFGMLAFIFSLDLAAQKSGTFSESLMSHVIPLFFLGFAFFQSWKCYRKYYANAAKK
jgi:threonine/homoserine/homoserine lactone efflux protein